MINRIILVMALVVGVYAGYRYWQAKEVVNAAQGERLLAAGGAGEFDGCAQKEFCVVAYLAPWCPYCQQKVDELRSMSGKAKKNQKYGLKVVVGAGADAANAQMAAAIGDLAILDPSKTIAAKLKVRAFPSYFVLDKEQSVILDGQEAYAWAHEKFAN